MYTLNFWPIIVASIAAFVIGAFWYSPVLFGKEWMKLTGTTEADVAATRAKGGMWKSYVIQLITTIVMFSVVGFVIDATNTLSAVDGAFLSFLLWLGFVATDGVSAMLWQKKSFRLVLIQAVGSLVTLVIGGAIIGGWR